VEDYLTRKVLRAVGEWSVYGGPWVDFAAMAVR
jgi:hypothetical protein